MVVERSFNYIPSTEPHEDLKMPLKKSKLKKLQCFGISQEFPNFLSIPNKNSAQSKCSVRASLANLLALWHASQYQADPENLLF